MVCSGGSRYLSLVGNVDPIISRWGSPSSNPESLVVLADSTNVDIKTLQ